MPLPNIQEFIGTNVKQSGFKSAQAKLIDYIAGLSIDVAASQGGAYSFTTIANFEANKVSVPANSKVEITSGADAGNYNYDGTNLTKSDYDPKSQAIKYVDENISSQNILTVADIVTDVFVNVFENKLQSAAGSSNVSTFIARVKPSTAYKINNFIYLENGFQIHESEEKSTNVGFELNKSNYLVDTKNVGWLITGENTNYIYINRTFDTYDNSAAEVINNDNVKVFEDSLVPISKFKRIANNGPDKSNNIYLNASFKPAQLVEINSGNLVNNPNFMIAVIEVEANQKYNFKTNEYSELGFVFAFRATSSNAPGQTTGFKNLSSIKFKIDNSFDFTVPDGMYYMFLNVWYVGENAFDIRGSTEIYKYGQSTALTEIDGMQLIDMQSRRFIDNSYTLDQKRCCIIGDSISNIYEFLSVPGYKNYLTQLKDKYEDFEIFSYAISGTGYNNRFNAADTITQTESDIDFIIVFMGINDWFNVGGASKPLGNFLDSSTSTIAGCINYLYLSLITKYPNTPIYVFTPLPTYQAFGFGGGVGHTGSSTYQLTELVDLIIKTANHYSLNVLDLYHKSNFKCQTEARKNQWTIGQDGVHPTREAHTKLLPIIENFLNSCAD